MLARQQKAELETAHEPGAVPAVSFKAVPQKDPDWATLHAEVTAQFTQTIAYLAK